DASERRAGFQLAPARGQIARRQPGDSRAGGLSAKGRLPDLRPILIDRFLEAGIHSGDSACVIPTFSLSRKVLDEIAAATKAMARELRVRGLMNVQFAVKDDQDYVLEVNPRASRTVSFVSKAIGVPLAKLAATVMTGKSLRELGFTK